MSSASDVGDYLSPGPYPALPPMLRGSNAGFRVGALANISAEFMTLVGLNLDLFTDILNTDTLIKFNHINYFDRDSKFLNLQS